MNSEQEKKVKNGSSDSKFSEFINPDFIDLLSKVIHLFIFICSVGVAVFLFFRYENMQKELSLKKLTEETKLSQLQLEKNKSLRIAMDMKIKLLKTKTQNTDELYAAGLKINFKNISDAEVELPYYIIRVFSGILNPAVINPGKKIHRFNDPDEKTINSNDEKVIIWKEEETEFFYRNRNDVALFQKSDMDNKCVKIQDAFYSSLKHAESREFEYPYLMQRPYPDFICFILTLGLKPIFENQEERIETRTYVEWLPVEF